MFNIHNLLTLFVFSPDIGFFLGRVDQESSHDTSMVASHVDHVVGLSVLHIPQVSSFGQNVVNLFFFPFWCEGCDIVQSDHAPQAGVAQGIFNGDLIRRRDGHQVELEEELEEEVERRVRRDHSRRPRHKCACMDDME